MILECSFPLRSDLPRLTLFVFRNGLVESETPVHPIHEMLQNILPSDLQQLSACRSLLEEVGLIHFNSTSGTIHIHGLTLSIVERALGDSLRRYASAQFSNVLKTERELSGIPPTEVERVFSLFFDFVIFTFIVAAGEEKCRQLFSWGHVLGSERLQDSCRTVYRVFTDYLEKQAHTVTTVLTDQVGSFSRKHKRVNCHVCLLTFASPDIKRI